MLIFSAFEIVNFLDDGIGVIGEGLHPIEEFGIALAVKGFGLVGDAGR